MLCKCTELARAMNHELKSIKSAAWFVNKEGHSSTHWEEQGGKVYTVGEKIQNTKLSGFFDERTIDFKINREDREHGQEFPMQRPHFSRKIRCMTRCLTLVSFYIVPKVHIHHSSTHCLTK